MACLVCHDVYTRAFERAGGRVVEGARLERVYGCKPIEGSNPSLSASSICQQVNLLFGTSHASLCKRAEQPRLFRQQAKSSSLLSPLTLGQPSFNVTAVPFPLPV